MEPVKCNCGELAAYAVRDDAEPKCLSCMLNAVDTPVAILIRTLDPWETNPIQTNNALGGNQGR